MSTTEVTPQPETTKTETENTKLVAVDARPSEIQKFEFQQRAAKLFAASGLFADIKGQSPEQSIAQAFVKIALGDSMGFNPAESMTGIDIIQGRVAVGSSLRAARMQRAGYSWDILQLDDKGCRLALKYKGQYLMCEQFNGDSNEMERVPTVVSFMAEDAAKAGLVGKDNYRKNPRNMFFARAITNAQRWYAPGILGVDILSSEEAADLDPVGNEPSTGVRLATERKAQQLIEAHKAKQSPTIEASDPKAPAPLETGNPSPSSPPLTDTPPASDLTSRSTGTSATTRASEPDGLPGVFDDAPVSRRRR